MKIRLLLILFLFAFTSAAQADQKDYYIRTTHAGSFAKAESARDRLKRYGNVQIARQGKQFIVWIGPVADRKEAIRLSDKIRDRYPNASLGKPDPIHFETAAAPDAVPDTAAPPSALSSPETLRNEGMAYFRARRYENAVEKLSLLMSLYPAHSLTPAAMVTVAGILSETKRYLAAIRLYSYALERYPGTPEAIEAMMALAEMGMSSPGLKPTIALIGTRWYLDPLEACDTALSQNPSPELTERLLFQRMAVLRAQGRYREAFTAVSRFIEQDPGTKHKQILLAALRSDMDHLIMERLAVGDDIAVIHFLSTGRRRGLISMTDTDLLIKSAGSYARLGMTAEARTLLSRARYFAADRIPQVDMALQQLEQVEGSPAISSSVVQRWALYHTGREQILSLKRSAAEKTLAQVKGNDQDEFWVKLVDFTLQENINISYYMEYIRK
jgi:tetratricopeptide (TPR) repeat protein